MDCNSKKEFFLRDFYLVFILKQCFKSEFPKTLLRKYEKEMFDLNCLIFEYFLVLQERENRLAARVAHRIDELSNVPVNMADDVRMKAEIGKSNC